MAISWAKGAESLKQRTSLPLALLPGRTEIDPKLPIAFAAHLAYARNPSGEPMQPNQYDAATSTAICLWCYSQYLKTTSRARDGRTFCSKKCEHEARYWLQDSVKSVNE
jgi:hypothetical protein